jgi:two-component system OmpR family sensor kinase
MMSTTFDNAIVAAQAALLTAAVGWITWHVTGRILRPVESITSELATTTFSDLSRRIPQQAGDDEIARLVRTLNQTLHRLERATHRQRGFVADASHELRTPLTTIRGFAELYRQGAARDPEQAQRLISRIESEAARMGLLVEDLLLLARLDQERPLELAPTDLQVIANDTVTAARVVAPDRRITLEIAEGTGPLLVSGDESRLRQVISNLMTNALTHTPTGGPVWLRLRREDDQGVIEIVDQGPGLAPDQVQRVFERFYRVDAARTRRAGTSAAPTSGTGLGLAIVAALVKAHGGTVEVLTEPGSGATFRVRLPLAQLPAPEPVTTGD